MRNTNKDDENRHERKIEKNKEENASKGKDEDEKESEAVLEIRDDVADSQPPCTA